MQTLICVTGLDGAGKSTLTEGLAAGLPGCGIATIWDVLERTDGPVLFQSKSDIDAYLCALTPDARLLFLAHALQFSIDKARQSGAQLVFINSYYYKYFASELALGARKALVLSLMQALPEPDLVLFLNLPPEVAVKRKKVLSRYECGLTERPDAASFLKFQENAAKQWSLFDQNHWIRLDASLPPAALVNKSLAMLASQKFVE